MSCKCWQSAYDKPFISVANEDALPVTDAEKASAEQAEKDHKDLLDFAQETLKGYGSRRSASPRS